MRVVLAVLALLLVAPASSDARPTKLHSGSVQLAFDLAFGLTLVQHGVTPAPVAPAKMDSVTFTLPVRSGRAAVRKSNVVTGGGFTMHQDPSEVEIGLTRIEAVVNGRKVSLRGLAALDGRKFDSFEFATGRAKQVIRKGSKFAVEGITLHLSDVGAASLNSQFSAKGYKTGQVVGTARIRASG